MHRRFFLHPIIIFLFLCTGVLLAVTTYRAFASNITVSAIVPAQPITQPVDIQDITPLLDDGTATQSVTPQGQAITYVDQPTVRLTGVCPKNSYIKFYDNGVFVGVTMCIGDPTFSIDIPLSAGLNSIVAKVYNSTDSGGPISLPILIFYGAKPGAAHVSTLERFLITSDFRYRAVRPGDAFEWTFNIIGGSAKYNLNVTWGDNRSTQLTKSKAGLFSVQHVYKKAGGYNGYYPIKVTATDAQGRAGFLQVMALVTSNKVLPMPTIPGNSFTGFLSNGKFDHWLGVAWPAYGIVGLMLVSFWLGERQELIHLMRKTPTRRLQTRR